MTIEIGEKLFSIIQFVVVGWMLGTIFSGRSK